MKRHLIKILLFVLVVALIDVAAGSIFTHLNRIARGGDTARNNYICNKTTEDVLIFGSSRAIHHYNPSIITDLTGSSCYNCGQDGNGIVLFSGRFHLICERYYPRVVIYDVMPLYDLFEGEANGKYLGWLRPYYDKDGIADFFDLVDPVEKYKMKSQFYRYNSRFVQIISDCLKPAEEDSCYGFSPLEAQLDTMKLKREVIESPVVDTLKIACINKMLDEAEGKTRFVFVVSPFWYGQDASLLEPIRQLCHRRGVLLLDYSNNPKYVGKNEYFADGVHLNATGADVFTRDVVARLQQAGVLNGQ